MTINGLFWLCFLAVGLAAVSPWVLEKARGLAF